MKAFHDFTCCLLVFINLVDYTNGNIPWGVESAVPDLKSSLVEVKGIFPAAELVKYVHKRTGIHAMIVKQHPEPKKEEDKNCKEEKKGGGGGEKKEEKKTDEGGQKQGAAAKPEDPSPHR
ncbi:hypothetical protein L2E82_16001 [Cichorium intybus]|uniref:Uncharacterized protein n=1 Tax=Cichorium intybus TaxID=13427 RepID=A0ACB9F3V4_CICIN|nr:hypothetical protein L2E82_16001 [Cichorium intybus]